MRALFLSSGLAFIVVPLVALWAAWTWAEPPAASLFWPKERARVVSAEVEARPAGDGTTAYYPVVTAMRGEDLTPILDFTRSGVSRDRARAIVEVLPAGALTPVRVAPDGTLYAAVFHAHFWAAVIASLLAPLAAYLGLFLLRLGLEA